MCPHTRAHVHCNMFPCIHVFHAMSPTPCNVAHVHMVQSFVSRLPATASPPPAGMESDDEAPAAPSRKRGRGYKQRQAKAAPPVLVSKFARFVIRGWAWGSWSPQGMQEVAALVVDDIKRARAQPDADFEELSILAGLGSGGSNPQNMNAELLRKLAPTHLPPGRRFELPLTSTAPQGWTPHAQSMWCPHEVFADMFSHYPAAFRKRVCPDTSALRNFWREMEGHPMLHGHPVLQVPDWQSRAVPIGFHGDGVPVTGVGKSWGKSLEILSWCSCVAFGRTVEANFYIFSVYKASFILF